ncbi:MAG: LytR C-terminal domain-containing protein, partial [Patescibacteria group bacterium]
PTPQPVVEAPAIVRVALFNGSQTVGVTNATESQLKSILPNSAVVSKENAKKNDYAKTVVVDITGANAESAEKIAQSLGGEVASLPEGETAPTDADVLIIVSAPEAPAPTPAPVEEKKKN